MWRTTITLGSVLIATAWAGAPALIGLGWLVDSLYISHLGIVSAALGATLMVCREHSRTRNHVFAVGMATRRTDEAPEERVPAPRPVGNIGRVTREQ